jgi:anti-anti-sigma factor
MRGPDPVRPETSAGWMHVAVPATAALDCLVESRLPVTMIRLDGRLDLTTVPGVRRVLDQCLAEQPEAIVVDLEAITVDDDSALTVFSTFARDANWPGCPIALAAPTPAVMERLDRLDIGRYLPIRPDRAQALAAAERQPASRQYSRRLSPTPMATRAARRMVVDACQAWERKEHTESAETIVTELVSNVVMHARTEMRVLLSFRAPLLHLSVLDYSPLLPRRQLPDPETGEGGRGLVLIEAMSTGWGVTVTKDGKVVWATLRTGTG